MLNSGQKELKYPFECRGKVNEVVIWAASVDWPGARTAG